MDENKKTKPSISSGFSDAQARDQFIGIALRALIEQQIATKTTGQYSVAADHAVRYADAVMQSRSKEVKVTVVTGGRGVPVQSVPPVPPGAPEAPKTDIADLDKSLGEMVGEETGEGQLPPNPVPGIASQLGSSLPPLAEVK